MIYRKEIDGLRAFAVLPVIMFHAGFDLFQGGFVGVDIFFVISGYLITNIILTELKKGIFSITDFYERRARRILPALFFVMILIIPFAWLYMPASAFKNFSQSIFAVSVFSSNILFMRESGYFDTASELKPLLHTWSLAVEEQFYLLFPLFLIIFWKLGTRWILVTLGLVFILSLALAQWAVLLKPTAAFYLLPTRGWELLFGAITAFYLDKANHIKISKIFCEFGGWLGVSLILYSIFSFNKTTPFPGFYALVPTAGTALIIIFASHHTIVGKFIGNKTFVGIGLISYSAYLWHQPLFAIARYRGFVELHHNVSLFLSVTTLLLAYLTWKFIEIPFRNKNTVSSKKLLIISILGSLFFISIGYLGYIKDGFIPEALTFNRVDNFKMANKNFTIIGDSHGSHLISGLKTITTGKIDNYTKDGCLPLRNVDRYDSRTVPGECVKIINTWLDQIYNNDPNSVIVLSSMGPVYLDGSAFMGKDIARINGLGVVLISDMSITDRYKVFEIGLRQTLSELSNLKNSTIVFSFDVPELGIDDGCSRTSKEYRFGSFVLRDLVVVLDPKNCFVLRSDYDLRVASYKKLVTNIVSEFNNVLLFDPADSFCDRKLCKGYDSKYGYLYRDADHLSYSGSRFYSEALMNFLSQK